MNMPSEGGEMMPGAEGKNKGSQQVEFSELRQMAGGIERRLGLDALSSGGEESESSSWKESFKDIAELMRARPERYKAFVTHGSDGHISGFMVVDLESKTRGRVLALRMRRSFSSEQQRTDIEQLFAVAKKELPEHIHLAAEVRGPSEGFSRAVKGEYKHFVFLVPKAANEHKQEEKTKKEATTENGSAAREAA